MSARTLFEKIWSTHLVQEESSIHPAILYIDCHLVHEVTSPQAFTELRVREIPVRNPEKTFVTVDHSVPTDPRREAYIDESARRQVDVLRQNCRQFGLRIFDLGSQEQGIVHVMGPELGLTLPGQIIVCGDSHTATHGAFAALAFGIGTSEVTDVLATQCLLQMKPKTMAVNVEGALGPGVSAKDLILSVIRLLGIGGATGYVIEYRGKVIEAMTMEERMTVCNMSIEAGAKSGLIAADEKTFVYLKGRRFVPRNWDEKLVSWRDCYSDEGAVFDREVSIDASRLMPMVTYGTTPDQVIGIEEMVPELDSESDQHLSEALKYMGLPAGQKMEGLSVDVVFIGSCTNGRISDLRAAARIFEGRIKADGVRVLVVPGSSAVKRQAEFEGLDQIFLHAGAEWRQPGCSMCIAMNGDQVKPGELVVSTSNRNFAGRQGRGGRTILASPQTAAATAIYGCLTDPRVFLT